MRNCLALAALLAGGAEALSAAEAALATLLAGGAEALSAAEAATDWNDMSAHDQYLAVVSGLDSVPDPKPVARSSLARALHRGGPGPIVENHPSAAAFVGDRFPGKSVIQSSCTPGVNDRSKETGEINPSCYWHEGSQTGNPHLRGHAILGPTDYENHFWHGLHTPATTTTAPPTTAPTRGAASVLEHSEFLSVREHTAYCHAKSITSCTSTGWCVIKADAKAGEQMCVFDERKTSELVAPVQHPQCRAGNGIALFPAVNAANNVCCHYACGQCNEECTANAVTIVPFQVIDDNVKKCQQKEELECTLTKGFCTFIGGANPRCDFDRDFTKAAIEQAEADPLNALAVHQGMSNKFHRANCCAPTIREANVACTGDNVPCVLKAVASESGI